MNKMAKRRIAAHKRWRAMMQTPGFRACYKGVMTQIRAMHAPCVVVPFATEPSPYDGVRVFNERPAAQSPRIVFNPHLALAPYEPLPPTHDVLLVHPREEALARLCWLLMSYT